MARYTPDEVAAKQAQRLKAALEDMRRGVERVQQAPTQLAAQQKEKLKARLLEAIDSGRWEKNTRAVTLSEWQQAMVNVGVNRVSAGIDQAYNKQVQFYSKLLPAIDAARSKIQGMPSVTLEDNINRMTTYIREMAKFKK